MEETEDQAGCSACCNLHWRGVALTIFLATFGAALAAERDQHYLRCFYVVVLMLFLWITDVYPRAITAMIPIVCFPLMNFMTSDTVCSLYFKESSVMFLITVITICAIEASGLSTRLGIFICGTCDLVPTRLHMVLVVVTAAMSLFVPNSVVATIMYPITNAVLDNLDSQGVCSKYADNNPDIPKAKKKPSKVSICFLLSIAYASSMGGTGFLTGTPTNIQFRKYYDKRFPNTPDKIDFINYLKYGFPPMLLYTALMYFIMQYLYLGLFRSGSPDALAVGLSEENRADVKARNREKSESLGPITVGQITISVLFVALLVLMITRKPEFTKGWGDVLDKQVMGNASVSTLIIYLMFALPAKFLFLKCWDESSVGKTPGLITWKFVNTYVPWDVMFIIGCGGALGEGIRISGLSKEFGENISKLHSLPGPLALFLLIVVVILVTNFTVNEAMMTVLAPGIIELAVKSKVHPLYFGMPSILACSMAFLLPTATAPNALVAALGNITPKEMIIGGIGPTIASLLTIMLTHMIFAGIAFSDINEFPDWVMAADTSADYDFH